MVTQLIATVEFDYSQLDETTRDALMDQENLLEAVIIRSKEEIGKILLTVKELLPPGMFMNWYQSKGVKRTYANESMLIALGKQPRLLWFVMIPGRFLPSNVAKNEYEES